MVLIMGLRYIFGRGCCCIQWVQMALGCITACSNTCYSSTAYTCSETLYNCAFVAGPCQVICNPCFLAPETDGCSLHGVVFNLTSPYALIPELVISTVLHVHNSAHPGRLSGCHEPFPPPVLHALLPLTWLCLQDDLVDEVADLNTVPNEKQELDITAGISNSFGFGGHNSVVAFAPFKQ